MRLVWHIVKKDFRRLAVPLALWALLLIVRGEVGVQVLTSQGTDAGRMFYLSIANVLLLWLDVVVCVLLVAALVHEDTLVGSGAGWATRPISGGRLLAAKLMGAALMFGALPLVIAVRWWLVCGYGVPEMAHAALAIADVQTVTVLSALLLAALTKNMNQFLGWLLGIGLAMVAWVFVLSVIVKGSQVEITRGVNETRVVLFLTLAAVGSAGLIVTQFLTRKRGRALTIAVVTGAAIAVVFASGWDFSELWARAPRTSPLANGIMVTVERPKIDRQGEMDYILRGVPPGFGVWASADHVWWWSDGKIAAARSGWGAGSWPGTAEWRLFGPHAGNDNELLMQAYAAFGPKRATAKDESIVPMRFLLWADKAERMRAEPATYTGELHVSLLRPILEFELPLRDIGQREHAGVSVRIARMRWSEGQWLVTLVESRPVWPGYGRARLSIATLVSNQAEPATGYALVNRARGEAVKLWPAELPSTRLIVGTQAITWTTLQCEITRDPAKGSHGTPSPWIVDATLAVVRYREETSFDREVTIEKFGAPTEDATAVK